MEWINKGIDNYENFCWKARNNMNQQLFETIDKWKWAGLMESLEWYFSIVEHLEEIDYLVKNLNQYDETLSELIKFSKTPFMEEKVWRVSDNGQFEEYCWEHLRNLLSPFKGVITVIKHFSRWQIKEDLFKCFVKNFEQTFEENKKMFSEFCEFLDENL